MAQDIVGLGRALRDGGTTAVELLETCLERIRRLDPGLNCFVALDETGAREAAGASDRLLSAGTPRSPLEGIPISIKDNILAAGMPATWGSKVLATFIPDRDELPVARLRAAGAVIVGKTNVPEFTLEGYTGNALFGVTRNPWDHRLTPGGSSGGAAASVAAGLTPAAIGTDGGGSIRRPACHTGLVGWKPSTGRIPRIDGFPAILTDFEVVGTLTRTLEDAVLLDAVMTGSDPRDRRSLCGQGATSPPRRPLRVCYVPRFGEFPVDPEVAVVTAGIASDLDAEGHEVREGGVFFDLEEASRIWHVISRTGIAWLLARHGKTAKDDVGPSVLSMAAEGEVLSATAYFDALEHIVAFRRRLAEFFADVDIVLTPTAAALPWPAELAYPDRIAGRAAGPRDHAIFTGWANIGGCPAINMPVATSASGLPIGVQFAAGFGDDPLLLDFSKGFERRHRAPPLPATGAS